jgi:thiamine-monophosphate kinase
MVIEKINDLGEFALIERFSSRWLGQGTPGVEGIGDDCAVLPAENEKSQLITTDMLIEHVHFKNDYGTPKKLGHKSLAVSLSDIAAMGGYPRHAFLSLALPESTSLKWVDDFFAGFNQLAQNTGVRLLGGDTTRSLGPIAVNVSVVGDMLTQNIKRRGAAVPGDILCVTGYLGDAAAGLRILTENLPAKEEDAALVNQHLEPRAHLREGQWLGEQGGVHAMLDLSDGLLSDLPHMLRASGCDGQVDLENLPHSESLQRAARTHDWHGEELALSGGEDYCLLVSLSCEHYESVAADFLARFDRPLSVIGEIIRGQGKAIYRRFGREVGIASRAFEHFPAKV